MKTLFADTFYWVALLNRKDPWHAAVVGFSKGLRAPRLVTTDEVLVEVLAYFSVAGPNARQRVAASSGPASTTRPSRSSRRLGARSSRRWISTRPAPTRDTA